MCFAFDVGFVGCLYYGVVVQRVIVVFVSYTVMLFWLRYRLREFCAIGPCYNPMCRLAAYRIITWTCCTELSDSISKQKKALAYRTQERRSHIARRRHNSRNPTNPTSNAKHTVGCLDKRPKSIVKVKPPKSNCQSQKYDAKV